MFEIALLFLAVYGISAAPGVPVLDPDYRSTGNEADVVFSHLPGSENLNEKALPLSKLFVREYAPLPGNHNLAERSQIPSQLPGTKNLAEKRIPELIIRKFYQPPNIRNQAQV